MNDGETAHLIASLPLALIVIGPDLRIELVNPAAEQLLGQSARRLHDRALAEVLRFDDARLTDRLGRDAQVAARDAGMTLIGRGKRRLDVTMTALIDRPGAHLLTLRDAAAIEGLGEDGGDGGAQVLRAPAILAHEIKNPLAGIRGAAQLLARNASDSDRALTTLIADEVDRIAKLIDQMQSLSRKSAEPVAPCNLHQAVRRASAVLEAAGGAALTIEEEFDPSLPEVLGNADGLVQVLLNLMTNARDAGHGAGLGAGQAAEPVRIVVRTRFASGLQLNAQGRGSPVPLPIELRVSDNGSGVDPALREHIFDPFVTSKKSGQGLGLALVRRLVRDMDGRIAHERDEATGWTHFRVHLPVARAAGKVAA